MAFAPFHRLAVASLIVLGVTLDADAQTLSVVPGAPSGVGFVTPLDNPVLNADLFLGELERGVRTVEDAWGFERFELITLTSCSPDDPFCIVQNTRGDAGALNAWPRVAGTWMAGDLIPIEMHGLAIGASPAVVRLDKAARVGDSMVMSTLGSVQVSLLPGTFLVPVNVVIVVPTNEVSSSIRSFMQSAWTDVSFFRALFDDLWQPALQRFTQPGGLLNAIQGEWIRRGQPSLTDGPTFGLVSGGEAYVRPDDVFAQCGIQFRLASAITIDESNPRNVFFTTNGQPSGTPLCSDGSGLTLRGIINSWRAAAMQSPSQILYGAFNQGGITVVFAPRIDHFNCLAQAKGLTDSGSRTVAIGVSTQQVSNNRLVLSHEIGHALGMDHPSLPCSNVMCAAGGNWTAHIPGCELRDGAPAAEVPYNCTPVPGESVPAIASCELARQQAGRVASAAAVPIPMEPTPSEPPPGGGGPGSGGGSSEWQSSNNDLSFDTSLFTEGSASLRIGGDSWRVVTSPNFRTADWFLVGNRLAFDVYLSPDQPNSFWYGSLDVLVSVPAAGIYNAYLGHQELTELGLEAWNTVEFDVPENVRMAFLGDFPGGSISIAVNTPVSAPAVLLDNLRFAGEVAERTVFHQGPVSGGASNPLFSFDNAANWSATGATLRSVPQPSTQGSASLGVLGGGYAQINSRFFSTDELVGITDMLSIDVFVPLEQPNPYWIGAIQAFVSCPELGLYNEYIGGQDLTPLFQGEFNTVTFPLLPDSVLTAFETPGTACMFTVALNVNAGSGEYLLDNLAFR